MRSIQSGFGMLVLLVRSILGGFERLVVATALLRLSTEEEHKESGQHRSRTHRPDDDGRRQRHERRYLVGEHRSQDRGEDPHASLRAAPRARPPRRAFKAVDGVEQQRQIGEGRRHERHGPRVVPGVVYGPAAIHKQNQEAEACGAGQATGGAQAQLGDVCRGSGGGRPCSSVSGVRG